MLNPKFYPYLSDETHKTEHGYEYITLKDNTPNDIRREYMQMVEEQDKRMKNNEFIVMF